MAISNDLVVDSLNRTITLKVPIQKTHDATYSVSELYDWMTRIWDETNAQNRIVTADLLVRWLLENGYETKPGQVKWEIVADEIGINLFVEADATTIRVSGQEKAKKIDLHDPSSLQEILKQIEKRKGVKSEL